MKPWWLVLLVAGCAASAPPDTVEPPPPQGEQVVEGGIEWTGVRVPADASAVWLPIDHVVLAEMHVGLAEGAPESWGLLVFTETPDGLRLLGGAVQDTVNRTGSTSLPAPPPAEEPPLKGPSRVLVGTGALTVRDNEPLRLPRSVPIEGPTHALAVAEGGEALIAWGAPVEDVPFGLPPWPDRITVEDGRPAEAHIRIGGVTFALGAFNEMFGSEGFEPELLLPVAAGAHQVSWDVRTQGQGATVLSSWVLGDAAHVQVDGTAHGQDVSGAHVIAGGETCQSPCLLQTAGILVSGEGTGDGSARIEATMTGALTSYLSIADVAWTLWSPRIISGLPS